MNHLIAKSYKQRSGGVQDWQLSFLRKSVNNINNKISKGKYHKVKRDKSRATVLTNKKSKLTSLLFGNIASTIGSSMDIKSKQNEKEQT